MMRRLSFQSTRLCGLRPDYQHHLHYLEQISIHSTLAGWDVKRRLAEPFWTGISIRSTLTGWDAILLLSSFVYQSFNPLTLTGWDCKLRLFSQRYYQPSAFSLDLSAIYSHHATILVIPVMNFGAKDPGISCLLAFRTQPYTSSLVKLLSSAVQREWSAAKQ